MATGLLDPAHDSMENGPETHNNNKAQAMYKLLFLFYFFDMSNVYRVKKRKGNQNIENISKLFEHYKNYELKI